MQFRSHFEGETSGNIELFRLPVSMPCLRYFAIMEICNWPYMLYLNFKFQKVFFLELGLDAEHHCGHLEIAYGSELVLPLVS